MKTKMSNKIYPSNLQLSDLNLNKQKKPNKTIIYKTKSNLAFAINFHSFTLRDKILMKNNLKNAFNSKKVEHFTDQQCKKKKQELNLDKSLITSNNLPTNTFCEPGSETVLIKEQDSFKEININNGNSKVKSGSFHNKSIEQHIDDIEDDVFDHESIINYFK